MLALDQDVSLRHLVVVEDVAGQLGADEFAQVAQRVGCRVQTLIEGHAHAQAKLGVIFEQRVGPCRAAPFGVLGPRCSGQVAAVDGRAAGGVGDDHAVAEELGHQLQIGRLTTAGASAGKLEQRLQELVVLDLIERHSRPIDVGQLLKEVPVLALRLAHGRRIVDHVDRLVLRLALVFDRADLVAQGTAGAILDRGLQRVELVFVLLKARRGRFKGRGRVFQEGRIVDLEADDAVRTDQGALAALDADLLIPLRHFGSDVTLFPLRCAGGVGSVHRQGADGQQVTQASHHPCRDVLDERRGLVGDDGRHRERAGDDRRNVYLMQMGQRGIDGGVVLFDDRLAALAVGLGNRFLDLGDGPLARQQRHGRGPFDEGEEARLHDGIDAPAHVGLVGHGVGIDNEEAQSLLDDASLGLLRQVVPHLIRPVGAVEEEGRSRLSQFEHVEALEEAELMAGDEVGAADQVGGVERPRPKAQVGHRDRAGLLRVEHEVALGVVRRILADDLDRVLVGADRAVGAKAEEHGPHHVIGLGRERIVVDQTGVGDIVVDADGEVVLHHRLGQLVIDSLDHRRRELL